MRLRNKPGAQEKLDNHPKQVIANPQDQKGKWNGIFGNNNPIHIEVGTGKGQFVTGMGQLHTDINYVGIEKFQSVIVNALDKVVENDSSNVKLLNEDALRIPEIFEKGEISRVYLNFSDPWPKNRHEKRRLTHKTFLDLYKHVLKENGEIHFKTDNQGLFEYSLESFSRYGLIIKNISLDLHNSDIEGNIMTEYEEKFSSKGQRIYRCEAEYK